MSTSNQVSKLYNTVVEDVINNLKEAFLDEGVDEQVLQDLKSLWESKLAASKALEPPPQLDIPPPQGVNVMLPQPIQAANSQPRPVLAAQPQAKVQPVAAAPQFQPNPATATVNPGAAPGAQAATLTLPSGFLPQQIATIGAGGQMQNITVQQTGTGQYITVAGLSQLSQFQHLQPAHQLGPAAVQVPQQVNLQHQQIHIQPQPLQQHQQQPKLLPHGATIIQQNPRGQVIAKGQTVEGVVQLDGAGDTSSSDDDDFDNDDDKEDDAKDDLEEEEPAEEEEPLNSGDDISEEDPTELFDSDNVVVCQYDKIHRNRNRWKFHLKDGIMNLNGRDFVFQKATGDSEW